MQIMQSIIIVFLVGSNAMDLLPLDFYKNFSRVVVSGSQNAASRGKSNSSIIIHKNESLTAVSNVATVVNLDKSIQSVDLLPLDFYTNYSRVVVAGSQNAASRGKSNSSIIIHKNKSSTAVSKIASMVNLDMSIQSKAALDINQKVYIEGQPTLGDGAGDGALNVCRSFAPQHVDSPDAPNVKVCGTGIKMTAYLLGGCKKYYKHWRIIGKCQTSMPSDTCESYSPTQDASFGAYQSYKIEQC